MSWFPFSLFPRVRVFVWRLAESMPIFGRERLFFIPMVSYPTDLPYPSSFSTAALLHRNATTRQSLKVDPRGPAIPNLLHPYLLLPRTDSARVKKGDYGHKTGRQGARILTRICEFGAFFCGASF